MGPSFSISAKLECQIEENAERTKADENPSRDLALVKKRDDKSYRVYLKDVSKTFSKKCRAHVVVDSPKDEKSPFLRLRQKRLTTLPRTVSAEPLSSTLTRIYGQSR